MTGYKSGSIPSVCARLTQVAKISDCEPEGPGFNPWPGQGLNFGRPPFTTVHGQGC